MKTNVRMKKVQKKPMYSTSGSLKERRGGALFVPVWPKSTCETARQTQGSAQTSGTANTWPVPKNEQRKWSTLCGVPLLARHQSGSVCDVAPLQDGARAVCQCLFARVVLWNRLLRGFTEEQTQNSAEPCKPHSSSTSYKDHVERTAHVDPTCQHQARLRSKTQLQCRCVMCSQTQ